MKNIVEETRQMNKMGTANIKKLMLSMGLPMIVSRRACSVSDCACDDEVYRKKQNCPDKSTG